MRTRSVVSEAGRNLLTGTSRAFGAALAIAVALAMLVAVEFATTGRLLAQVSQFVTGGASTFVISSIGNVDPAACEALTSTRVLDRAGVLRHVDAARLAVFLSSTIQVYEASPGLLDQLAPLRANRDHAGVYVSTALADAVVPALSLGRTPSPPVTVDPLTVLGSYAWPDDGRPTPLQYAVLAPAPLVGVYDECWVRAADPTHDPSVLLRSVLVRDPTDPADGKITQLNSRLGSQLTAPADFATRPTQWAPLAATGIGAGLAVLLTWLRRLELASARQVGVPGVSQVTGQLLETLAWAVAGIVLVMPWVLMRTNAVDAEHQTGLVQLAVPILLGGLGGALLGSMLATPVVSRHPVDAYLRTR